MLMPRKVAHRKHHRGRTKGMTKGGANLSFGEYGIQALEPGWLTETVIGLPRSFFASTAVGSKPSTFSA